MKGILHVMAIALLLLMLFFRIAKQDVSRQTQTTPVANDCIPKGASIARHKKASVMQCAHACLGNHNCEYFAVRKMTESNIQCDLFKKGSFDHGFRAKEGWTLYQQTQLHPDDSNKKTPEIDNKGCKQYHFSRDSLQDYVNFSLSTMPDLTAFTICCKADILNTKSALIGYWAPDWGSKIVVTSKRIHINHENRDLPIAQAQTGLWCITWKSQSGKVKFYDRGQLVVQYNNMLKHQVVKGGGDIILGQMYCSCANKEFEREASFTGNISDVAMWNRELGHGEISNIVNRNSLPNPTVFNWDTFMRKATIYGDVKLRDSC